MVKQFEEYINLGTVIKQRIDEPLSQSLNNEAKNRKKFLESIKKDVGLRDDNANYFIETAYDILMGLIRSKLLSKGFRSSGSNSHEAEISFLLKLGFSEKEMKFADELRYFRNKILYEGKPLNKEYAQKTIKFVEEMYTKLK